MMVRSVLLACLAMHALVARASTAEDELEIYQRCVASSERAHELAFGDRRLLERAQARPAAVPAHFAEALARLLKVARVPAEVRIDLVGVHSNGSASVLSSGIIFVSSQLWRGALGLEKDEAAAVLAHEIAHVEMSHVRNRHCEAVAAAGDEGMALADAAQAVHQAIWAGDSQLAVKMMQKNHARELDADLRAVELLDLAGFRPGAVPRLLLKIARMGGSGYSWSHPSMEARLENVGTVKGHGAAF